jgi:cysteinyl-tRNA synthetase
MDDDFNVPRALARIFELAPKINGLKNGQIPIDQIDTATVEFMKEQLAKMLFDVFGLRRDAGEERETGRLDSVMKLVLELRQKAREEKDWKTADKIRDMLLDAQITVKDGKDGTTWN